MAFMKQALWVSIAFGFILGGLSIAQLIANGLETEFVALPGKIMMAYGSISSALAYYLVEIPFNYSPPAWAIDLSIFWIVCALSNLRSLFIIRKLFPERTVEITEVSVHVSIFLYFNMTATALVFAGPIGSAIILRATFRELIERLPDPIWFVFRKHFQAPPLPNVEIIEYPPRPWHRAYAVMLVSPLLVMVANPIVAAGLLWWNAAEIERLTAGMG